MQSSPRIDELRQKFHENPRRYFAPLANEYRKAGDPEQAIAICRAHLAQQPGHMSGHVVYGQALYDADRMDEARVVFQQALALDPENLVVLRHLGDIARRRGDAAEARSWYSRALDGDPQDAEVAAYLAELTEPLVVSEAHESALFAPETSEPETPVVAQADASTAEGEPDLLAAPAADSEIPQVESTLDEESDVDVAVSTQSGPPDDSMFGDFSLVEETELTTAPSPYADMTVSAQTSDESHAPDDSPYLEEAVAKDAAAEAAPVAEAEPLDSSDDIAMAAETGAADMETEGAPAPATSEPEPARDDRPSRFTPEFERTPIVTRTLAELYLQQGYIESALEIYRQLAEREPDDASLRRRITELSGLGVTGPSEWEESSAPAEGAEDLEPQVKSEPEAELETEADLETEAELDAVPAEEPDFDIGPMMPSESDLTAAAEVNELSGSSELWDTADSWSTGLFDEAEEADEVFAGSAMEDATPVPETRDQAPETRNTEPEITAEAEPPAPEAPGAKTPAAEVPAEEEEPEGHAAPQAPAHRRVTIREFFATLGEMRPPSATEVSEVSEVTIDETEAPAPASIAEEESYLYADDAFATLFENEPVNPEDSRAAAALSDAVAHPVPLSPLTTSGERGPSSDSGVARQREQPAKESEEDIRRFREWLEGLANS